MANKLKITHTPTTDAQVRDKFVSPTLISSNNVGGTGGMTSQTGNTIRPYVKIGAQAAAAGSILAQKGAKKFLVTSGTAINDEDMVVGSIYRILTVGTTDWVAVGASKSNAQVGGIFVAKAAGAGSGTVTLVGVCTLANKASGSLGANEMSILVTKQDASTFYASRITNKWVYDFSTPADKFRYWLAAATTNNDYATDKAAGTTAFVQVDAA